MQADAFCRHCMNILWVENHASFARIAVRRFLAGHSVTVVPSLAEARAALTANTFAVVLIDYDLDDGKGDELVRELRGVQNGPRIVATSSHDEGNRLLVEAGAHAVCGKMQFGRIADVLAKVTSETTDGER
jgi:DNA-binding response OmpR family regulator